MAGLLDIFNGDDGQQALGLLAAAGPSMQPMNLASRLALAGQTYNELKDNALKNQLTKAQIDNFSSEIDSRRAALEKQQQLLKLFSQPESMGAVPAMPGQLGSGSFGIQPPPAGQPAIPALPQASGQGMIANMNPERLAQAKLLGVDLADIYKLAQPDMQVTNGYAYDKKKVQPGFLPQLNVSQNGDATQVTIGPDGLPRISAPAGSLETSALSTFAKKAPETLLNAAASLNLRDNADGTKTPVSALDENQTLQGVLRNLLGNRGGLGTPTPAAGTPARPVVSAADQKAADADSLRMMQEELKNPNLTASDKASLQREIGRLQLSQGQPGFPSPSLVRNPQGYGMTNEQAARAAAEQERLKTRAMGSEKSGQDYQNALNDKVDNEFQLVNRNKMIEPLLDKFKTGGFAPDERLHFANALQNSGMLPAGVKDKVASWVTGGDPTAGKVIENQIASAAITTMLDTLNKEGKPNRAIFQQLQKAQEGLQSGNTTLKDVFALQKQLYDIHYKEQQALTKAVKSGEYNPATWAGDYSAVRNSDLSQPQPALPSAKAASMAAKPSALPTPMKGMVRNGYKFNGGDPASPSSWEKQ